MINTSSIVSEIDIHINLKCGSTYFDWYVGIAKDPRDRMFQDHNVDESNGCWIYKDCGTDSLAREIEQYFLRKGCKGGDGGGDWQTKYVYAYKITSQTRE